MYSTDELCQIVNRSAGLLNININQYGASEIARRSRGTPRIANRLLKRIRDFAQVEGEDVITSEIADFGLSKLEIDKLGLDNTDRAILETIAKKFAGGPVGIGTLASSINEERDTIEDVYEPYLLQLGFIKKTPKGRCVTRLAYEHLNIPYEQK
jgi:Holliday junction DNA helicase RuvB